MTQTNNQQQVKINRELPNWRFQRALELYGDFLCDLYTELDNVEQVGRETNDEEGNVVNFQVGTLSTKLVAAIGQLHDQTLSRPENFQDIEVPEYKQLIQEMVNPDKVYRGVTYYAKEKKRLNENYSLSRVKRVIISDVPKMRIVSNTKVRMRTPAKRSHTGKQLPYEKTCSRCGETKVRSTEFGFSPSNADYATDKCIECLDKAKLS